MLGQALPLARNAECTACPKHSSTPGRLIAVSVAKCLCEAGHYMSSGTCESRPEGAYSGLAGATSIAVCAKCPSVPVTASVGSTAQDRCVCPPGKEPDGQATDCKACPRGFYKESLGADACMRCPLTEGCS